MARPAIDWLITDTHWFHDAMVRLCGRPHDFTKRLIKNLRMSIGPNDRLFHLGDVIFYQMPKLKPILDSIPGTKILLMGNHDKKSPRWYMRNGFAFASDMIVVGGILLSHKPVQVLPDGVCINIHGHWHNDEHHERPEWYTQNHLLLSVEKTNYKPVQMGEFVKQVPSVIHLPVEDKIRCSVERKE